MAEESTTPKEPSTYHAPPPPPPDPSADIGILRLSPGGPPETPSIQDIDISSLSSLAALKLLSAGVEWLVRMTGDIPPTPPTEPETGAQSWRNMRSMQAEKENIVKSTSQTNLAQMMNLSTEIRRKPPTPTTTTNSAEPDGIFIRKTPLVRSRNEELAKPLEPYLVIGANAEPLNIQHSAITRKFYCKQPPPISLEDYLIRIHKYCPMSCAVYLATSYYIHKLAVEERAIPVTRRNSHRLLLAGLRVAMKALEDLSYPHSRLSKVGGVSSRELVVLEVSFCFLTGFELCVRKEVLERHARLLRDLCGRQGAVGGGAFVPRLPVGKGLRGVGGGGEKGVKEVVVTNA